MMPSSLFDWYESHSLDNIMIVLHVLSIVHEVLLKSNFVAMTLVQSLDMFCVSLLVLSLSLSHSCFTFGTAFLSSRRIGLE